MASIFDMLTGTPQPSRIGTLSSLASMPLNMPSLVPSGAASTSGYGDGLGANQRYKGSSGYAGIRAMMDESARAPYENVTTRAQRGSTSIPSLLR